MKFIIFVISAFLILPIFADDVSSMYAKVKQSENKLGDFRFRIYSDEPRYEVWQYYKKDERSLYASFYRSWAEHGYLSPEIHGVAEVCVFGEDLFGRKNRNYLYLTPNTKLSGNVLHYRKDDEKQYQKAILFERPSEKIKIFQELSKKTTFEDFEDFFAIEYQLSNKLLDKHGVTNHTLNVCWPYCSSVYPVRVTILVNKKNHLIYSIISKVGAYQDVALCEYRSNLTYEAFDKVREIAAGLDFSVNVPLELAVVAEKIYNTVGK